MSEEEGRDRREMPESKNEWRFMAIEKECMKEREIEEG